MFGAINSFYYICERVSAKKEWAFNYPEMWKDWIWQQKREKT